MKKIVSGSRTRKDQRAKIPIVLLTEHNPRFKITKKARKTLW